MSLHHSGSLMWRCCESRRRGKTPRQRHKSAALTPHIGVISTKSLQSKQIQRRARCARYLCRASLTFDLLSCDQRWAVRECRRSHRDSTQRGCRAAAGAGSVHRSTWAACASGVGQKHPRVDLRLCLVRGYSLVGFVPSAVGTEGRVNVAESTVSVVSGAPRPASGAQRARNSGATLGPSAEHATGHGPNSGAAPPGPGTHLSTPVRLGSHPRHRVVRLLTNGETMVAVAVGER